MKSETIEKISEALNAIRQAVDADAEFEFISAEADGDSDRTSEVHLSETAFRGLYGDSGELEDREIHYRMQITVNGVKVFCIIEKVVDDRMRRPSCNTLGVNQVRRGGYSHY